MFKKLKLPYISIWIV